MARRVGWGLWAIGSVVGWGLGYQIFQRLNLPFYFLQSKTHALWALDPRFFSCLPDDH